MDYHKDGTVPEDKNSILVFGSNLAGIHGAGAAKLAFDQYGAKPRQGMGFQGRSYAIPTKNAEFKVMPLSAIAEHIEQFKLFAFQHPEVNFFVTAVGTGLSRYKDKDIAPLFKGCGENCNMPEQWQKYLEE